MSQRHLTTGSTCPDLAPGTLRLYSMRYCPYAQRARLVLAHCKTPHEVCNVDLKKKPEWYFAKNAGGLVPTLEQDDKLIQESHICMDYLEDITPGANLYPKDPYLKARMRLDMESLSKYIPKFYKVLRCEDSERGEAVIQLRVELDNAEKALKAKFFSGDSPTMIDYYLYPWFERFCVYKLMTGSELMDASRFPKLRAWYEAMVAHHVVKQTYTKPESHDKYLQMYKTGKIDFDFEM